MNSVNFAFGIIAVAFVLNVIAAGLAFISATRGTQRPAIGRALVGSFGLLVVGVGLLITNYLAEIGLVVGFLQILVGLAVLALALRVEVRAR